MSRFNVILNFLLNMEAGSTLRALTDDRVDSPSMIRFSVFVIIFKVCCFLFCVEPHLMRLAVTMFILGVGTSPGGKARVGKSNTMNTGVGGGRPLTSPAPGSVGRRSTISYDQAKTSSSSTERTNEVPRYSGIQFLLVHSNVRALLNLFIIGNWM